MEKEDSKKVTKPTVKTTEMTKTNESKGKLGEKVEEKRPLRDVNTPKTGKVMPKTNITIKKVLRKRSSTAGSPQSSISKIHTNSARKPMWKRRPLPAHSGVPVPEKMKKLSLKLLNMDSYKDEQV
ncbi:unnamed protein product [Pieris macdunnoughi]|uniref:Uncharacterized protein n=1 Tax=Pieris macdunnoughi TaxID=345717 RepID=A0A821YHU5_9NEOP|nr:unnamed protein product [Pieris macdunnoughi]